jgi:Fe-S cluster assembly scaffold protein SufB
MARPGGMNIDRARSLATEVYQLQLALVRHINDTHIFVQQALPLLQKAQKRYSSSEDDDDRAYVVPSHKKSGVARRTDEELKEIYERYIAADLYNNLLVAMVSRCESYLVDVLRLVLRAYPRKITMNVQGVEQKRTVDAEIVLNADDLDAVRCSMIEELTCPLFLIHS